MLTGASAGAAIEAISAQSLRDFEIRFQDALIQTVSGLTEESPSRINIRLINGLMRGSSNMNESQVKQDLSILMGISEVDPKVSEIFTQIMQSNERMRKQVHKLRTEKSAVKQVLRALSEDIYFLSVDWIESPDFENKHQQQLLAFNIDSLAALENWGEKVADLYKRLFVTKGDETKVTRKSRSTVSEAASRNYQNTWMRFIVEHGTEILEFARKNPEQKLVTKKQVLLQSAIEDSYNSNSRNYQPQNYSPAITIQIENSGTKPLSMHKTWISDKEAKENSTELVEWLKSFLGEGSRIDRVTIESPKTKINLEDVKAEEIEKALKVLL